MHALGCHVGEAVARRVHDLGRAAQLRLHVGGHELLDELPTNRRRELAARHLLAVAQMVSVSVASSNLVASVASRSSRISIRKLILGRCRGAFGIEPPGAVLDGIGPVERQRLARA